MGLLNALKWSFLSELASKAVTPIVFIILARLLTPEDYGVVAAATMVISFSQIFWEAGMGKAIIQYQGERDTAANTAFWINIGLGAVVGLLLISFSGIIAEKIFQDSRVASVLKVMSLQVFLSATAAVHTALLQKDMRFKHLFGIRLATVSIPGLISIPLAWYGFGYWALVSGAVVGQFAQVLILWQTSPWRPKFYFSYVESQVLCRFGIWVAATGVLAWFYIWVDSLIIGIFLGPRELGLYRTGNIFVMSIFGIIFGPAIPVLYSHLSVIQKDVKKVALFMRKSVIFLTLFSVPLGFFIFLNSDFISNLIFNDSWAGINQVLAFLALAHGYAWVAGLNGEVYRAIGSPHIESIVMGTMLFFYIPGYIIGAHYGFYVFLWVRFGLSLTALIAHFWALKKVLHVELLDFGSYLLKVTAVCATSLVISFLASGGVLFVATATLFCALVWSLDREGFIPSLAAVFKGEKVNL